jgi:hypothetical protein
MTRTMMTLVAGLAMVAGPALSQSAPLPPDADGNGTWSLEEMQAVLPDMTAEGFAAIDTDADGAVNPDELQAAIGAGLVVLPE